MASASSLSTALSPLSPLLNFTPSMGADWTTGWIQGWNNDGPWDGSSKRWAEAWASADAIAAEFTFYGSSLSVLFESTDFYNVSLRINDTFVSSLSSLSSPVTSLNSTSLPLGSHSVQAVFRSIDSSRTPTQEQHLRFLGFDTAWDGATAVSSSVDDSLWVSSQLSFSQGWNLMSASNPAANILNQTEADLLSPTMSRFGNSSISWTDFSGSSVTIPFTGNYIAVKAPLSPLGGVFRPNLDGVDLPTVDANRNLPQVALDSSMMFDQIVFFMAGLSNSNHSLTLTNVGGSATGDGGRLFVDSFLTANVVAAEVARVASPTAFSSTTFSSTSPSESATPGSPPPSMSAAGTSSSTIGVYVAVGVGGVALIGLAILFLWKCRNRRKGVRGVASTAPFMKSKTNAATTYPAFGGYSAHPFQPLVDSSPQASVSAFDSRSNAHASAMAPSTVAPSSAAVMARGPGLPSHPRSTSHILINDRPMSQEGEIGFLPSPGGTTPTETSPDSASIYSHETRGNSYFDLDDERSTARESTRRSDVLVFHPEPAGYQPPRGFI